VGKVRVLVRDDDVAASGHELDTLDGQKPAVLLGVRLELGQHDVRDQVFLRNEPQTRRVLHFLGHADDLAQQLHVGGLVQLDVLQGGRHGVFRLVSSATKVRMTL